MLEMLSRIKEIRDCYEFMTPLILERSKQRSANWISPYVYFGDWHNIMSPIEYQTWQAIRCFGKIPLYPQYPVSKYFLDFGNPFLKIAVECDGKEWHQDVEKDIRRDEALFEEGWKVYRISGADCNRLVSDDYYSISEFYYPDEKGEILNDFYEGTIEGLLKALAIYYCGYTGYYEDPNELSYVRTCLDKRVSLKEKIYHLYV